MAGLFATNKAYQQSKQMRSVQSSIVQIKFKQPFKGKTYVWELIAEMYWCSNVESCKWMQQPIVCISEGNKKISWNKVH